MKYLLPPHVEVLTRRNKYKSNISTVKYIPN